MKFKFLLSIILSLAIMSLGYPSFLIQAFWDNIWNQGLPNPYLAQMEGTTYKIITDSLNSGGNDFSNSSNYILSDTIGENATGISSSTNFTLSAGYRQMQDSFISISSEADVNLGSVSGLGSGFGTGSATWTVITDNSAGYSLSIEATSSPAMISTDGFNYYFDDYTPSGGDPDYTFSILATQSAFGFTPEGDDIVNRFKDNGGTCGVGTQDNTDRCWDGLSTSAQTVSQGNSANQPSGTQTTIKFRAENGASHIQEAATYEATIIMTAVTL